MLPTRGSLASPFFLLQTTIPPHNIIFPQLNSPKTSNALIYHTFKTSTRFKLPLKVTL